MFEENGFANIGNFRDYLNYFSLLV